MPIQFSILENVVCTWELDLVFELGPNVFEFEKKCQN